MRVQSSIENAAVQVISASLAALNITGVTVLTGMDTGSVSYPLVQVVCSTFQPQYKELNIGYGKALLTIAAAGIKQEMSASQFEYFADSVIEPFFSGSIVNTMNGYAINIRLQALYDNGLDVTTLTDGWMARQDFELVVARTS